MLRAGPAIFVIDIATNVGHKWHCWPIVRMPRLADVFTVPSMLVPLEQCELHTYLRICLVPACSLV